MCIQSCKFFSKIWANILAHALCQCLALHQVYIGQPHRARHRMPAIGVSVVELATLLDQHLGYPVADHHATERHITAGHGLGKSHQIGAITEFFVGKPVPQAPEGAYHLVADQQNCVFVNNALDLRPIGSGRDDDPASALHRLGDKGRHPLRPERQDLFLKPASGAQAEFVRRLARTPEIKVIRLLDMGDVRYR